MNFETFLNQAWQHHNSQTEQVAARLREGISLIENENQVPQLATLIAHVYGEHLGKWQEGIELLGILKNKMPENTNAIARAIASLKVASGLNLDPNGFTSSDQIRILAVAASAISTRDARRAGEMLRFALQMTGDLKKEDPANRALAVTGHNLACSLEEKTSRTEEEKNLMILAAQTGRQYWEIAGGPAEVAMAEYRQAMTYLKADGLDQALVHAKLCLEVCEKNKVGALDMFYAYEVNAIIAKAKAKETFNQLPEGDKKWCEAAVAKL
jgi:hypothetical protein